MAEVMTTDETIVDVTARLDATDVAFQARSYRNITQEDLPELRARAEDYALLNQLQQNQRITTSLREGATASVVVMETEETQS